MNKIIAFILLAVVFTFGLFIFGESARYIHCKNKASNMNTEYKFDLVSGCYLLNGSGGYVNEKNYKN